MGRRKKEAAGMGRSLIKDRFQGKSVRRGGDSFLHTTELNDGYEGRSVNLSSLTEQTSMAEFLSTAEMAGRDFTAEKENVQIVTPLLNSGVMSKEALKKVKDKQDLHRSLLRIPRRPAWTEDTPADKLQQDERVSFLEWRRQLAKLQEEEHIVITPYEKNLEFWRQLWRVIERSDVVVQIVDARHPLLFWCRDLDAYVREVNPRKHTMLLVNKADLLTVPQREAWAEYFASQGVNVVFWSAVEEAARLEGEMNATSAQEDKSIGDEDDHMHRDDDSSDDSDKVNSEGEQDSAVTKPQRTNDVKSDDKKDEDDDGTKGSGDVASVTDTVACGSGDHIHKTDTAARDEKLIAPHHSNNSGKTSSDSQNTTATVEYGCEGDVEDGDEDDDDEGDDNQGSDAEDDEDSDGYETIEEDTDDEGEGDDGDRREAGKPDSGKSLESPPAGQRDEPQPPKPVAVADSRLQTSAELLMLFRRAARTQHQAGVTTVGMVGYPNVGKSSTINTILRDKKVPVSATPGRTKHFQTLYVEKDLLLCDCPGLVFPSFVNSKADLVVNGILPIDQLQDSEPPVELVCQSVGRAALEGLYHLNLPPPEEWEDPDTPPSAYHLLQAYGALRGFMSHKGNPDRPRAARYILKDFVNGKLLFCHPPPGIDSAAFQKPPYTAPRALSHAPKACNTKTASQIKSEALAQEFFNQVHVKAHALGPRSVSNQVRMEGLRPVAAGQGQGQGQGQGSESSTPHGSQTSLVGKPWKKHNNRNKKEKLRRLHKDLDTY